MPAQASDWIPTSLEQITPAWLTGSLSKTFPALEVENATPTMVIHGTAVKAILALDYRGAAQANWPRSICIKGGLGQAHAPQLAKGGFYRIEGRFYNDLAPTLGINVPKTYEIRIDPETDDAMYVMEDLVGAGAHFLRVTTDRFSYDEAADLLSQLAVLHAYGWNNPKAADWLWSGVTRDDPFGAYLFGHSAAEVGQWMDIRGGGLSPHNRDPQRLIDALWRLQATSMNAPLFPLHGDCHVGNMYRLANGRMGLCDWQTMFKGRWSHDVAYLLGSGLDPAKRGQQERKLLDHYMFELKARGAPAMSSEDTWQEYRRAMVYGLFGWLTNPLYFQPEEISGTTTSRFAIATEELGTIDLLMAA